MNSNVVMPQANILVVDDTPANLRLLSHTLNQAGYEVRGVVTGEMAIRTAKSQPPDLILLDIKMPDLDGYEICACLKSDSQTKDIPIIFLSAVDEVLDKVKAFSIGAADYITKPFQIEEVLARVKNQLSLQAAKRQIAKLNSQLEERVSERTKQLEVANEKLAAEIIQRQKIQEELEYLALNDSLTKLPNRLLFMNRLQENLDHLQLQQTTSNNFTVLFLDCDRFKLVNDSLGHFIGDNLLIAVSQRILSCLGEEDILSRFGGDEFAILLNNLESVDYAIRLTEQILARLNLTFYLNGHEVFLSASVGIVFVDSAQQKPEDILRNADIAMYKAKDSGKACYKVFDDKMHELASRRLELETDLRLALAREEFVAYYQPIISLQTGKIRAFEALIRWRHPHKGLISPGEFIPIIEETGLIVPVGLWILRQACQQLRSWQKKFARYDWQISVNLSVKQFAQPDLINQIDQILAETKLSPSYLKLEITESAIMSNANSATEILQQLRDRQIELSIDDFGTGYSSLSYLHRFPVDTLKIDRSFIARLDAQGNNIAIVEAIITLARQLDMNIIAEGIEHSWQANLLREIGCEAAQGFLYSRPLSADSLAEFLINQEKKAEKSLFKA